MLPLTGPGVAMHKVGGLDDGQAYLCRLRPPPSNASAAAGSSSVDPHTRFCAGVAPLGLLRAAWHLNKRMLTHNAGIKTGHKDGSTWEVWPLNSKPVWFSQVKACHAQQHCRIYMGGNPVGFRIGAVGGAVLSLWLLHRAGRMAARAAHTAWARCRAPTSRARAGGPPPQRGLCGGTRGYISEIMSPPQRGPNVGTTGAGPVSHGGPQPRFVWHGSLLTFGHALAWLPFAWVGRVTFL
jgi:hypothetical protein